MDVLHVSLHILFLLKHLATSWWHPACYAVGIFLMRSSWRHISSNVSKIWHNSRVKFVARCLRRKSIWRDTWRTSMDRWRTRVRFEMI
jgi:hypothetical protein